MNKTKRTLIVSSIVMVLVLVVAIVSATAAWFSNYASSKPDTGFIADSQVISESVSITIDEGVDSLEGYGTSIWPAVSKDGYLSKGGVAPYGSELKQVVKNKTTKAARCAVLYFNINCVGAPDKNVSGAAIDDRKSLAVSVQNATLGEGGKDYLSEFNVEMELVSIIETDGDKKVETIAKNDDPKVNSVYYVQPNKNGDEKTPSNTLYMLVVPGETYYVKATIYFNKVDEECLDELIHFGVDDKGIAVQKLNFKFDILNKLDESIDIREGHLG